MNGKLIPSLMKSITQATGALLALSVISLAQEAKELPAEAKRLKAAYTDAVERQTKPLRDRYAADLNRLLDQLTRAGRLDDAIAIKDELSTLGSSATPSALARRITEYWRFDNGGKMELKEDGTASRPTGKAGRWSWTNSGKGEFRVRWENHHDDLVVGESGEKLTGMSSTAIRLNVDRISKSEYEK